MGALMHKLHADQQRLEECAETIPGLLVMEFEAPARRSSSEFRLMTQCAEQRELIAALQERNAVLARRVADLSQDLRTLKGENATPQRGCRITTVPFLMGSLLCEVEGDGKEELTVCNVLVNGRWLDPQDVAAFMDVDHLGELVIDAEAE